MASSIPAWRAGYERVREAFANNRRLDLSHLRFQLIGPETDLPEHWRASVEKADEQRQTIWQPGCPDLATYEQAQQGILFGDREAMTLFDALAREAWQAVPGSSAGKLQATLFATNDTDRWLTIMYHQLSDAGTQDLHYFEQDDFVVFRSENGELTIQPADRYALPMTYGPILDPDTRPSLTVPFKRVRITRPTVNLFVGSVVALDILLASSDGSRLISWEEFDQNANHVLDYILLGQGRRFPIHRYSCRIVPGTAPSVCPKSDPKVPVEFLPKIAELYRGLGFAKDGQTIHWVGNQTAIGSVCTCSAAVVAGISAEELPAYVLTDQPWFGPLPSVKNVPADELLAHASQVELVLLTATQPELDAVLRQLAPSLPSSEAVLMGFVEQETYYLGQFGSLIAAVTKCRMGSLDAGSAALTTEHAQRIWNPRAVVMVGIALGKGPPRQKIADVLVASQVISYEPQRVGEGQAIPRGPHTPADPTLLNRFEHVTTWSFARPDGSRSERHVGPLVSGEKLIDDPPFKAELFERYPQAIGGDMEGVGLAAAAGRSGVACILVKAICDWADGKKHSVHQPLAAAAAVSLVHHVLSQRDVLHGLHKKRPD